MVARPGATTHVQYGLLAAVLVMAAALRFTALGWGLRHTPHIDEQFFVENVRGMLARGDLDHRFHEYPGLAFYLLLPFVGAVDRTTLAREGYLLARGVVAAFGVASVLVAFLLGRRMAGPAAGLFAALLLAVSPIEVQTAHMVRPDVILETFVLLAFLALARVGEGRRFDLFAGAAIGAAVAVKFSGVLLAPSYLARRLLAPGGKVAPLALAAAASLAVFALCSPYTFVDFQGFLGGARAQVGYHYEVRPRGEQPLWALALTYVRVLAKGLGVAGLALAVFGAAAVRRDWRRFVPLAVFPCVIVAVFSTAEVNRDRFMLPALGVLAVLAGAAVAWLAARSRALAVAIALLAAGPPLARSVRYLAAIARPGTRDQAVDWVNANVPAGARLLTTLPELGLDRGRYEVLTADQFDERAALLAGSVDVLAATGAPPGLRILSRIEPGDPNEGPPIVLGEPETRRRLRPVALGGGEVSASENPERVGDMLDGRLDTRWESAAPQAPGATLEVRLATPRALGGVELALGDRPRHYAANLHVFTLGPDGSWTRVRVAEGRPPLDQQLGERSQLLLFPTTPAHGLRLRQVGRRVRPWSVAELRLLEEVSGSGPDGSAW
ncbi:MAG TPA: glycosyltransferase family 39 protein [Vicinamibacteria bacterium]|nr:glycosyltransferase family 39 protein [Vicinamibacteria bacterium]